MSDDQRKAEKKQPIIGRLHPFVLRVLRIFSKPTSKAQSEKNDFWDGLSLSEIIIEHLNYKFPDYADQPKYLLEEMKKVAKYHNNLTLLDINLGRFKKARRFVDEHI